MEIPLWPLADWQLLKSFAGWSVWAHDGQVLPEMQSWRCTHQLHTNERRKWNNCIRALQDSHSQRFHRSLLFLAQPPTHYKKETLNDHAILKIETKASEINSHLNFATYNTYFMVQSLKMLYYILQYWIAENLSWTTHWIILFIEKKNFPPTDQHYIPLPFETQHCYSVLPIILLSSVFNTLAFYNLSLSVDKVEVNFFE